MIIYIQERERRPDVFPPESDSDLGIYEYKIDIREKSLARIYVKNEEDIIRVENIIKEMDPIEFQYYYPKNFVGKFEKYPVWCVYIGKFVCDWNKLLKVTKEANIPCFIVSEGEEIYRC